jgi:hypothetical protein
MKGNITFLLIALWQVHFMHQITTWKIRCIDRLPKHQIHGNVRVQLVGFNLHNFVRVVYTVNSIMDHSLHRGVFKAFGALLSEISTQKISNFVKPCDFIGYFYFYYSISRF